VDPAVITSNPAFIPVITAPAVLPDNTVALGTRPQQEVRKLHDREDVHQVEEQLHVRAPLVA
jgi:hypothetical protein